MLEALSKNGPEPVYDNGRLHVYRPANGVWEQVSAEEQSRLIQSFAGGRNSSSGRSLKINARQVSGARTLAAAQASRAGFFGAAPKGIAFRNGFLAVSHGGAELCAHSPDHRATLVLDQEYDPHARCPEFQAVLEGCFQGDEDAADKIAVLQEFAGASLVGLAPRYQKCLVLVGKGANGKSTVTDIIAGIFPKEARASVAPDLWGNEYRRALLPGVRLNAISEIPDRDIAASETFKAVISGDMIDAREIRQSPFGFRPSAGHLFSANSLPNLSDLSEGFWRRFVVIRFNRRFVGKEKVLDLADKVLRREKTGITNWAVEGVQRLLGRGDCGDYTIPLSSEAEREEWRNQCNSVAMFLDDCGYQDSPAWPDGKALWTRAKLLYEMYRNWCNESGHRAVASNKFSRRMEELGKLKKRDTNGQHYGVFIPRIDKGPVLARQTFAAEFADRVTHRKPSIQKDQICKITNRKS